MTCLISSDKDRSFETKELQKNSKLDVGEITNNIPRTQSPYVISFWLLVFTACIFGFWYFLFRKTIRAKK